MRRNALALRMSLLACALGIAAAIIVALLGYWVLSRQLDFRAKDELKGRMEFIRHIVSENSTISDVRSDMHRLKDLLIGHNELHLALADGKSKSVIAAFSPIALSTVERFPASSSQGFHEWRVNGSSLMLSSIGEAHTARGEPLTVYLTLNRIEDQTLLAGFFKTVGITMPLVVIPIALGAWWAVRRGLKPLRDFQVLANAVSPRSLGHRIQVATLPNELQEVAKSFNAMLSRIDEGVTRLSQFSTDLSHEMRTPVSNLLGKTQVALTRVRSAEDYKFVLESNVEELERLVRLIADMLFLAQSERAESALRKEVFSLGGEARHAADFFSLAADEKAVTIILEGDAKLWADRLMIQRAISNLLSNAIRHATPGSAVHVRIGSAGCGDTTLAVSNNGEEIKPEHQKRVFDRFYRVDPGRARNVGGSGLGLAIVHSVMSVHEGSTLVQSAEGVTTFTLVFPDRASNDVVSMPLATSG